MKTKKLAAKAVGPQKIKPGAVRTPKIDDGAVSAAKLATIVEAHSDDLTLDLGAIGSIADLCPDETVVVSGGFTSDLGGSARLSVSERGGNGWMVRVVNASPSSQGTVRAIAYCLES